MSNFQKIRAECISQAKKTIQESINQDNFIVHSINNIEELAKVTNVLSKRLRDWYNIYLPEFSKKISDHETFVSLILEKDRKALIKELGLKESMGKDLEKKDLEPIIELAKKIRSLYELRDGLKKYLEKTMDEYCKNLNYITGSLLGAKLIEEAGSLKRLAMMPSSTIQLLGAEKALFRHIKTGARSPKHGFIFQHPLVSKARLKDRGRHARVLADKINIAVKTDYFKGEFNGDRLKKELEEKLR
jgi:nucleolar protein 56